MASWQCPACGSPLSEGQRYCAACGTFLTSETGPDPHPDTAEVRYYPDGEPYPGPTAYPGTNQGDYPQPGDNPYSQGGYADTSYDPNVQYPQGGYAEHPGVGYQGYDQQYDQQYHEQQYDQQQYDEHYGQAEQYPESSPYHYAQPQPGQPVAGQYPPTGPIYPPTGPVPSGSGQDETWKRRMQAIVGITAILFLAAGTVVGIIYLRSGSDDPTAGAATGPSTEASPRPPNSTTPSSAPAITTEPAPTTSTTTTTTQPPPTTAPSTTAAGPTSLSPPDYSDPNWPSKPNDQADTRGWLASKWTRCPSDQIAVLLMQTPRFKVTVCSASGALTYHGWKIGGADGIVVADTQFDGTTYTAVNKSTTYTVGPGGLQVVQDGKTLVQEPATVRWPN